MSSDRRLFGARIVSAFAASALLASPLAAQAPRAAVVVTIDGGASPELASELEQFATAHLRAEGHDVVDSGTVRAAIHFQFADAIPSDEAGLQELRTQLGAARLLHVNVHASAPDRPLSLAVRDLSDGSPTAAFGEIPPGSPGELATILARLPRPDTGTPAPSQSAPEPAQPAPEPALESSPEPAPEARDSNATPGATVPGSSEPEALLSTSGSAETAASERDASRLRARGGYRIRAAAALELSHAVFPSADREEAAHEYNGNRTLVALGVELALIEWLSVRLLAAWLRAEMTCIGSISSYTCPPQLAAELLGAGITVELHIPIEIALRPGGADGGAIIIAPALGLSGLIFPSVHAATPTFLSGAYLGGRVTWRIDRVFGLFIGGRFNVDVLFIDPVELGYHPDYQLWYYYNPLLGGTGELGAELSF